MSQMGIGATISYLGGNADSVAAFRQAVGKEIAALVLSKEGDGSVEFTFTDGGTLSLYDDARSCCESRWLDTDDDLSYHVGATLTTAEVREGPTETGEYGDPTESAFLHVTTSRGVFVVKAYNSHNGYYGGISIRARSSPSTPQEER